MLGLVYIAPGCRPWLPDDWGWPERTALLLGMMLGWLALVALAIVAIEKLTKHAKG